MAGKSLSQPDPAIAALLKQCRKDGRSGYIGKIIRKVGREERVIAVILADQERAYAALVARPSDIIHYLRVDNVQIQAGVQDSSLATAIVASSYVKLYRPFLRRKNIERIFCFSAAETEIRRESAER